MTSTTYSAKHKMTKDQADVLSFLFLTTPTLAEIGNAMDSGLDLKKSESNFEIKKDPLSCQYKKYEDLLKTIELEDDLLVDDNMESNIAREYDIKDSCDSESKSKIGITSLPENINNSLLLVESKLMKPAFVAYALYACKTVISAFVKSSGGPGAAASALARLPIGAIAMSGMAGGLNGAPAGGLSFAGSSNPISDFESTIESGLTQTESLLEAELGTVSNHVGLLSLSSACLFIGSIRGLNSIKTAKQGNMMGILATAIGLLSVLASPGFAASHVHLRFLSVFSAAAGVGWYVGQNVSMERMPETVALLHGFVGLSAVLVGFSNHFAGDAGLIFLKLLEEFIGISIGSLTFTGSIVAAGKLYGSISGKPLILENRWTLNGAGLLASVLLGFVYTHPGSFPIRGLHLLTMLLNTAIWGGLGANMVLPVGGADMPVVVSLLNSFSGIATSAAGFMLGNDLLTITGALVTSSGALLSDIMCKGINRSLTSVMLGGFGTDGGDAKPIAGGAASLEGKEYTEVSHKALVDKLLEAKRILIVPGYGLAVARCQARLAELVQYLKGLKKTIHFGIHPVAGRLPGHMNVLLAEANINYQIVKEMDEINENISSYDIALVIGANDIVNPATQSDPSSPIYGMPAVECWKCNSCVVLKRGMATGYSGVENPLFYLDNVRMLFGDAKESVDTLANLTRMVNNSSSTPTVSKSSANGAFNNSSTTCTTDGETGLQSEDDDENMSEIFGSDAKKMEEEREHLNSIVYPTPNKTIGILNEYQADSNSQSLSHSLNMSMKNVDGSMINSSGNMSSSFSTVERRVAITPNVISKLRKMGFKIVLESKAGEAAGFSDAMYVEKAGGLRGDNTGIEIVNSSREVFQLSDLIVKVSAPTQPEIDSLRKNQMFVGIWGMYQNERILEWIQTANNISEAEIDPLTGTVSTKSTNCDGSDLNSSSNANSVSAVAPLTEVVVDSQKDVVNQRTFIFNLSLIPRISRAQALDCLTSQANIAGYRAVLDAFSHFQKFSKPCAQAGFGQTPPAKVFIIGAGVAGLSAIGTATGMGAKVYATDVRSAAKEQVESLGGTFVSVGKKFMMSGEGNAGYAKDMGSVAGFQEKQQQLYGKMCKECDIVITTALIPNRPAPVCIDSEIVKSMKPGSVIIDLAALNGGNCTYTVKDEKIVTDNNITIIGKTNYPGQDMPGQASDFLSRNFINFFEILYGKDGKESQNPNVNMEDVIVRDSLISINRSIMWPPPRKPEPTPAANATPGDKDKPDSSNKTTPNINTATTSTTGKSNLSTPGGRMSSAVNLGSALVQEVSAALVSPSVSEAARSLALGGGAASEPSEFEKTLNFSAILDWINEHEEELAMFLGTGLVIAIGLGTSIPPKELQHLGYFVLSLMLGHFSVASVTPALHTPLISVTNAISGIIVIGGMLQLSGPLLSCKVACAMLAVFFSSLNIVGGFAVTERMLDMFVQK